MNLLTAAKAALEALETCDWNDNDFPDDTQYFDRFAVSEAATKLRAAIEEAEKQEPVAEVVQMYGGSGGMVRMLPNVKTPPVGTQLYAGDAPSTPAGWRPIETAPKDINVLLCVAGAYTPIYCGRLRYGTLGEPQQDVFAWRCSSSGRFTNPTHWMPLPTAPKPEKKS